MPFGFRGDAAHQYLLAVDTALVAAGDVHSHDPFAGISGGTTSLPHRSNEYAPHEPASAYSGHSVRGLGSSSNIVVDEHEYNTTLNNIKRIDENAAARFEGVVSEIMDLCQTSFALPRTTLESETMAIGVRNTMDDYRSLMERAQKEIDGFIGDILAIR